MNSLVLRKKRVAAWLASVVFAAAGTVALAPAYAFEGGPPASGHGPMMKDHAKHLDHLLDAAEATPDQRTRIHQIMKSAFDDLKTQRQARTQADPAIKEEWIKLLSQPKVDVAAFEALHVKEQAQHADASKRMTQAWVDAANVLTPEQRVKAFEKMHEQREKMKDHWKARQQERREKATP